MIQLPLFSPKTSWTAPDSLPEQLLSSKAIALDVETYDPLLKSKGPSWRYGEGKLIGIALASETEEFYLPIGHNGGGNLDRSIVLSFIKELLNQSLDVYMANAQYDLGWLYYVGVFDIIRFRPIDIQITESLICEEHPQGYSLDSLSKRYLNRSKDERLLQEATNAFGVSPKGQMHELPAGYVGQYAEIDARNTFDIARAQEPIVEKEQIRKVWNLETDIIPLIHYMGRNGVPFDVSRAEKLNSELLLRENKLLEGFNFDIWSNPQTAKALQKEGFKLPLTEAKNPSAGKKVLKAIAKPGNLPSRIMEIRQLNKLRKDFVEGALESVYRGKIFPQFVQLASDEGGTRSGRMACKNPNIQQVPKRSGIGKEIRKLYYTADPSILWGKFDYSSQEPRFQVHYGLALGLKGAQGAKDAFVRGEKLYTFMEQNIPGVSYDDAKALVLGRSYGMGIDTMAEMLGITKDECQAVLEKFDDGVPYIKNLFDMAEAKAGREGFIRTVLGRKRRFLYWKLKGDRKTPPVFGYNNAKRKWPNNIIERADCRKAFNGLIQGSSADQTKQAMLNIWRETGKIPYSQVHDEINYPIYEKEHEVPLIKRMMAEAIPGLLCPFEADCDLGERWQ